MTHPLAIRFAQMSLAFGSEPTEAIQQHLDDVRLRRAQIAQGVMIPPDPGLARHERNLMDEMEMWFGKQLARRKEAN